MNLRDVLTLFEAGKSVSLAQMARECDIEPTALEGMLDFWVRKGKLRESTYTNCADCGVHHACPVGMALPKRYELVSGDAPASGACAHCKPQQ